MHDGSRSGSTNRFHGRDAVSVLALAGVWVFVSIAVNPIGGFPLNDDWSYGKAVQQLLATGVVHIPDWSAVNHIVQLYWGALFCLPFGFSFTALRFSTLTMGLAGILAVYALLREFQPRPPVPLLGALVVAMNPIFLGLSNTFMTDVPFFALFTGSLWLLARGLRRERTGGLIAGLIVAALALLIRQFGLILFIAFGGAYLFKKRFSLRRGVTALLIAALGPGLQVGYQSWLRATERAPAFFGSASREASRVLAAGAGPVTTEILKRILVFGIYSGMFLFPVLLVVALRQFRSWTTVRRRWTAGFLTVFTVVTLLEFVLHKIWMPFTNNVMSAVGLGPLTLRDASFGPTSFATPPIGQALWCGLTVIGILGAGLLYVIAFLGLERIFQKRRGTGRPEKWPAVLVVLAAAVYFFSILGRAFFDRYLLPLWPLFLLLGAALTLEGDDTPRIPRAAVAASAGLILVYSAFAIGATHDYLEWNRVRWDAARALMQDVGTTPRHIDGGFEFNGWYLYDRGFQSTPGKSWWWVADDEYSIVFGPLPDYQVVKTYPVKRWLPFGPERILVVRRNSSASRPDP